MFNWLPILLRDLGLVRWQGGFCMTMFMVCAVVGNIAISQLVTGERRWAVVGGVFAGTIATLLLFGVPGIGFIALVSLSGAAGLFILSATVLLYGLATDIYPASVRGTGVGAATAVGRLGAVGGPLLAGGLISMGLTTSALLPALAPFALIGGVAAVLVAQRTQ